MDYILENGALDYITLNGHTLISTFELEETINIPLMRFEKIARKVEGDWQLHIERALRSSIYQRQGKNKWVLVECGEGYV